MRTSYYLDKVPKAIRHPDKAVRFILPKVQNFFSIETVRFWHYYRKCRKPKVWYGVPNIDLRMQNEIEKKLVESGFILVDYYMSVDGYWDYMNRVNYQIYTNYHEGNEFNKTLQHYLATELLDLSENDIYVDIASGGSPAADLYNRLYGCRSYKQDLIYPEGISGDTIGGDAGNLPVEDGFATKMALHCSFEMFERDSDIKFIREADRVLSRGGRLCIVPLYLFPSYAIQTNPVSAAISHMTFESDAILFCKKGWWRHARFYDVPHLASRIRNNLGNLELTIYVLRNGKDVDPTCWVNFIALFRKAKC